VFSIKPLPTANKAADRKADTPMVDYTRMSQAMKSGGKIYNVNVRGKRGNIVQVYPSVEYDFVPNSLALGTNDMVHFQWTGSDYNPRRGCNDATGGPPDLNLFTTNPNAENPRADRSNVMFTYHMGNNVPMDYLGYPHDDANMTYADKRSMANMTVLSNVPCYDPAVDTQDTANACYQSVMRMAYLNQQSDSGSLLLRQGMNCLTTAELDAILNQDQADFHPLNCAKLNAKPYSYFDAGVIIMRKNGWFPYYSSRNNNFSNRQQIGVICVGPSCKVSNDTSVLQDTNPNTNGDARTKKTMAISACQDTAGGQSGANSNGVTSCLPNKPKQQTPKTVLQSETISVQEGDNDNKGDGNAQGCAILSMARDSASSSVENNVALAIGLLFVGLFCSWLAYYLYNRYQARQEGESKFRYDTAWQKAGAPDGAVAGAAAGAGGRPSSGVFSESNPGIKMARSIKRAPAASAGAAAGAGAAAVAGSSSPAAGSSSSAARAASPSAGRVGSSKAVPGITRPASSAKGNQRYEMI
jgi:hypothetical protein